eukprot:Nk52_evm68s158 gene=Nk52_evmTU68s158
MVAGWSSSSINDFFEDHILPLYGWFLQSSYNPFILHHHPDSVAASSSSNSSTSSLLGTVTDQAVSWGATIALWLAVWAFLQEIVLYRYLERYTDYDKVRKLDRRHREYLYEYMCRLEEMEKREREEGRRRRREEEEKKKKEKNKGEEKNNATKEKGEKEGKERGYHELLIRERLAELAEIRESKMNLQNKVDDLKKSKSSTRDNNNNNNNNNEGEGEEEEEGRGLGRSRNNNMWHEQFNPYQRFLMFEKGEDYLKDIYKEEEEGEGEEGEVVKDNQGKGKVASIKTQKVDHFWEICCKDRLPEGLASHTHTALELYKSGTISYYQLTDLLLDRFIVGKKYEHIGWLQILAPGYPDLIRFQFKVERFREENPVECQGLPLFQEIRSLIYVLGSTTAPLDLKHAACLSIIELFTGKSLDPIATSDEYKGREEEEDFAENNTNAPTLPKIHRGPLDVNMEELFMVCQGPKLLFELSEKHRGIRKATLLILNYLKTLANLDEYRNHEDPSQVEEEEEGELEEERGHSCDATSDGRGRRTRRVRKKKDWGLLSLLLFRNPFLGKGLENNGGSSSSLNQYGRGGRSMSGLSTRAGALERFGRGSGSGGGAVNRRGGLGGGRGESIGREE